ncbi:hypothetical protein Tco_0044369 [Tanacetum coccineum]
MERELRELLLFTKKKCFVCGSLSHLIKDCDYYEKKMAREAEFKKQRVFNTGNGVAKPVWTNANRVNHANKFVPRLVQLNAGRPNINSVRPNIKTGRPNINSLGFIVYCYGQTINSVRPNINTGRTNVNPVRPRVNTGSSNVNTVRSRQPVPVKTSNSFSPKRPQDHPLKNMVDRGIFDSGCSGNGQVTRSNWRILKEFNGDLLPLEVAKATYLFDMKTPTLEKGFACLIAKATSDESKLWHRRLGASEVTNSACTSQTPYSNASEEKDEDVEIIVVPLTVKNTKEKAESRKSSTNSKKEEILREPQQEKKASSTDTSEDNPKILAFRRELEEIALKHLGKVLEITSRNEGDWYKMGLRIKEEQKENGCQK